MSMLHGPIQAMRELDGCADPYNKLTEKVFHVWNALGSTSRAQPEAPNTESRWY
jgi:hypothetical protein